MSILTLFLQAKAGSGLAFDWTINLGHILTLAGFVGVGVSLYFALKTTVTVLTVKLDIFGGRLINLENDLRGINKVLTEVAVQDERMTNLEKRVDDMGRDNESHRKWTRENVAYLLRLAKVDPKTD